jgi:hypothetical protein
MGETAEAIASYDRALALDPANIPARQERDALEAASRAPR